MPTQIVLDSGIYLPELDLWVDARRRQPVSVVSHAHADHWARHDRLIGTAATLALIKLRWPSASGLALAYGQPLDGDGYRLTLFPAGHCLGSAQVLIEVERTGERILYTGDFKLRLNCTAESAPIISCDTLIMDATYGHPRYRFPPSEEVIAQLCEAIDSCLSQDVIPVVLAYAVGKAQEVLKILLGRGYRVITHRQVYRGARVYEALGVQFGLGYECYGESDLGGGVLIFPTSASGDERALLLAGRRVRTVRLTGWAIDAWRSSWWGDGLAFPFSDHADFGDLLTYAKESAASRIFTVGGYPQAARELRGRGFDAWHLRHGPSPLL